MIDLKTIEEATGEVLVAVATEKVTAAIESLADSLIRYHDHKRFADNAAGNIVCYLNQHKRKEALDCDRSSLKSKAKA
jgi:hypothetical protein